MDLVNGTIIARHGALIRVRTAQQTMLATARRTLRWEGGKPAAPKLVVGDRVSLELRGGDGVIVAVGQRTNNLVRRAPGSFRPQVIAANVDQALLVFAARIPEPRQGLVDRFLVACQLAGIDPVITINKVDQGTGTIEKWLGAYEALDYTVLRVSARTGWGLGRIKRGLAEKTTLFCGPSGAGKSSLLNAAYPGFRLRVGIVSEATNKGRHTTSRAELMPLPFGGFVVDTPGVKEFGLWDLDPESLQLAFPEISELRAGCKFANCSHLHEPSCAVLAAVEANLINHGRFRSYRTLCGDIE
jgi:ribosome biogenesis GTPase